MEQFYEKYSCQHFLMHLNATIFQQSHIFLKIRRKKNILWHKFQKMALPIILFHFYETIFRKMAENLTISLKNVKIVHFW